jgi:hypothetical protein
MSDSSSPLIQTLTPERWAGLSMDFIGAGYVGLLVKNGQFVRKLEAGRHISFAMPYFTQCQVILVDSKIRNLPVMSQGDFFSQDQYLLNISLNIMYQVIDPKRVAIELSDPVGALISAVKDNLGVIVNEMKLDELLQSGRVQIRDYLLSRPDTYYLLGFNLEDVRVSDIHFPQKRGVIRQVEGLTARAEAEHEANLKAQIASAGPTIQVQANSVVPVSPAPIALPNASPEFTAVLMGKPAPVPSPSTRTPLPPTTLAPDTAGAIARLVHRTTQQIVALHMIPFTIGREPDNSLVSESPLCSRHHARIDQVMDTPNEVQFHLTDVGSSNGTFVNGQRLTPKQPHRLESGVVIRIGTDEWTFEQN